MKWTLDDLHETFCLHLVLLSSAVAGDLISGNQYGTGLASCYSTLVVAKDNVGCWFGLCSDKDVFEILGRW